MARNLGARVPACAMLLSALVGSAGCDGSTASPRDSAPSAASNDGGGAPVVALRSAYEEAIALADSVEELLRPVPLLTPGEEAALRTSNAAQLARARRLGEHVADSASLERLVRSGGLVQLEDSTEWWVVRALDHSLPYVTPDVPVLLEQIGERFQAVLRERGLPPYRIEVTSVLRTPAGQEALRAGNVNAARGTSTHEFGTTVDIAYESYAAPADSALDEVGLVDPPVDTAQASNPAQPTRAAPARSTAVESVAWLERQIRVLALERVAAQKSRELQKLLGGVLRAMQSEGLLLVTLERQQPVYHLTVGRTLTDR